MSQQVCAGTGIKAGLGAPATDSPYIDFRAMGVQQIKSYDEFKHCLLYKSDAADDAVIV